MLLLQLLLLLLLLQGEVVSAFAIAHLLLQKSLEDGVASAARTGARGFFGNGGCPPHFQLSQAAHLMEGGAPAAVHAPCVAVETGVPVHCWPLMAPILARPAAHHKLFKVLQNAQAIPRAPERPANLPTAFFTSGLWVLIRLSWRRFNAPIELIV